MKKKLFEHLGGNSFKLIKESTLPSIETYIIDPVTDEEIPVTVEYEYTPASRGSREPGTGLRLEPDESPSIDIFSVKDEHGKVYHLTDSEEDRIVGLISDKIAGEESDDDDSYYDDFE